MGKKDLAENSKNPGTNKNFISAETGFHWIIGCRMMVKYFKRRFYTNSNFDRHKAPNLI